MTHEVFKINVGNWYYFMNKKYLKHFFKTSKGGSEDSNDFGITGKYLFFHEDPVILEKVARNEISNGGFDVAKINNKLVGNSTEHVLCLYYRDDSRKYELAKKYQENNGIKYRYWKSDEDTLKGKYSKEFLDKVRGAKRR